MLLVVVTWNPCCLLSFISSIIASALLYCKCCLPSMPLLGCCSVSVSSWGGLHDCIQSSSRAEQVHQSRRRSSRDDLRHLWTSVMAFSFFCLCSHDAMDSFYDYIWDVTILEYLTRILSLSMMTDNIQLSLICSVLMLFQVLVLLWKWSILFLCSSLTLLRYSSQTWRDWEETNSGKQCFLNKRPIRFMKMVLNSTFTPSNVNFKFLPNFPIITA